MPRLYLPARGHDAKDLTGTLELLRLFKAKEDALGLMLVSANGMKDFEGTPAAEHRSNLERAAKELGRLNFVVMAPNRVADLDFHHLPEKSLASLKTVVDFAGRLPRTGDGPVVSFHLNTLFTAQEWSNAGEGPDEKLEFFSAIFREQVLPVLEAAAQYGRSSGVALKIETTPVPEFGDLPDADLNSLGNPFPLYSQRCESELRQLGFGIVMDLCHSHTLLAAARMIDGGKAGCDDYKGLFPADVRYLARTTLLEEVKALKPGDMVHLNDSRGLFNAPPGTLHEEGVALGDGEIPDMPAIIRELLAKDLPIIFEINEADYVRRPNLRRSIDYFLEHAQDH